MGHAGKKSNRDEPTRRCIVSGKTFPKESLIRFVLDLENGVTPDITERLPGRGLWVQADRASLEEAIAKNLFSKSAKTKAVVPDNLLELTEQVLVRRVSELISLMRRSGQARAGFEKVKATLVNEEAQILLQASDGSDGQKRKLRPPKGPESLISCLSAEELGLAFGRENVIHATLLKGGLLAKVMSEANRLEKLRLNQAKLGKKAGSSRHER